MEAERERARGRVGPEEDGLWRISDSYRVHFHEKWREREETPQLSDQVTKFIDVNLETWLWSRLKPCQFG